jgi:hypothetical protein
VTALALTTLYRNPGFLPLITDIRGFKTINDSLKTSKILVSGISA